MIGKEGIAAEVKLTEGQKQLTKYPPGVTSHVTITTAVRYHPKDVGFMVYRLQGAAVACSATLLHWQVHKLVNDEGWICDLKEQVLQGMVEEVDLPPKREMLTRTMSETKDSESLLEEVPQELWTRPDNDVGRIIGAAPLMVKQQPGARWPNVATER